MSELVHINQVMLSAFQDELGQMLKEAGIVSKAVGTAAKPNIVGNIGEALGNFASKFKLPTVKPALPTVAPAPIAPVAPAAPKPPGMLRAGAQQAKAGINVPSIPKWGPGVPMNVQQAQSAGRAPVIRQRKAMQATV